FNPELFQKNFKVIHMRHQPEGLDVFDIASPEQRRSIVKALTSEPYGAEVIIFDNKAYLAQSEKDEDDSVEQRPLNKLFKEFQRHGAGCISVQHSDKSGQTYRGSSGQGAVFDVIIGLRVYNKNQKSPFELWYQKTRHFKPTEDEARTKTEIIDHQED